VSRISRESTVLHLSIVPAQLRYFVQISLLAALYFLVAKLSLLAAIPPGYATSVWPPSGIALAAILLYGTRLWPGIWIGAALVNLTVQSSVVAALMIGTGNVIEAVAGAALIKNQMGVPRHFQRGEDVFKFVVLAAAASTIAATIGTVAVATVAGLPAEGIATAWWTWWQGDTTGMVVVAPLILAWTIAPAVPWTARRKREVAVFGFIVLLVGYVAFGTSLASPLFSPLLLLLTLPLVIWAALRFDQREVVVTIAVLCAMAVGFTVAGRGPLASGSVDASLLQLLVFISAVAMTGLSIGAVVNERRRAMEALRESRDELERRVYQQTWELRQNEETFRLLVEGIQDYAIFMLDPDGKIVSWNKGAQSIYGYAAGEIVGQTVSCFYSPDAIERKQAQQLLALAKAQGRCEDEGWRARKDGTRFWANVVLTALYDHAGGFRGFAKVTRDMTEPKRIESLEQRERQTNEFLAMLGHELRNPLAPIRNALSLMGMQAADEATREWSRNVIDRQVRQLTRIVDDLLDVARITSGKIELRKEHVELNAAVLRALESCRPFAEARRQILEVETSKEHVLVDGDLIRLSQIVLNLLNNAIKYTPDGETIAVSVARDGDWAVLRVRDTGIGIPAELLPKVFDLFVQGERSLARTEGGLGIGLTIVRKLVALHGGTVSVRSDGPGKGSEFVVLLPALSDAQTVGESGATWQPGNARIRRRVLIVDDDRDLAETAAVLLKASGHEVRIAHDGASALAIAAEYRPDVVLLDIGLPGMNGYDVARHLRASEQRHPMMLVALTGYGHDVDRQRAREAGFDQHVVKPLEPATLERLVESISMRAMVIEPRSSGTAAGTAHEPGQVRQLRR
jgi:PAS domain S-box-containing protein